MWMGKGGSNLVLLILAVPFLILVVLIWLFGREAEYLFDGRDDDE
jgi:hypothetical protein